MIRDPVDEPKWILGIRPGHDGLTIDPYIPKDWREFEVVRQWRGSTFEIKVKNPHGVEKGVKEITVNGKSVTGPIPIQPPGEQVHVIVTMG